MVEHLRDITEKLKERLGVLYGPRLIAVYIFGSYARGEADGESDLDVLILLDRVEHYADEVRRVGGILSKLSLQCGISIIPVFVSQEQWSNADTMFLSNIVEEAIAL